MQQQATELRSQAGERRTPNVRPSSSRYTVHGAMVRERRATNTHSQWTTCKRIAHGNGNGKQSTGNIFWTRTASPRLR